MLVHPKLRWIAVRVSALAAWATAASVALAAPSFAREPILDCVPKGDARPVCGFHNPEDLALLPSGRALVVSQMGRVREFTPGTLAFYDPTRGTITIAFPRLDPVAPLPVAGWGDASCTGPPAGFSPHGLSLALRPDGKLQLLVVNHGGRESVEFFEVNDQAPGPELEWRGCVVAPAPLFLNDVATLRDGGFVATHMFPKGTDTASGIRGMLGRSTGYVVEWHAGDVFRKVPGSDADMPNGIEVSSDGEYLYVNAYLKNEIVKLSRKTGKVLARAGIKRPDNLSWTPQGTLLVASHDALLSEVLDCRNLERGACPAAFSIIELDPVTFSMRTLYENEGPPMGAATSAIRVGDEIFIGSNAGDRILRMALRR